jgi:plastocyanin
MSSLRLTAGAVGVALFALATLSVASAAATAPAAVTIDNFMFSPMEVTVPVGAVVTWTNRDDIPHTVRAVDGSFHSAAMDTGESYRFTFATPGVYSYFCSIHPRMVGKIIVKAAP